MEFPGSRQWVICPFGARRAGGILISYRQRLDRANSFQTIFLKTRASYFLVCPGKSQLALVITAVINRGFSNAQRCPGLAACPMAPSLGANSEQATQWVLVWAVGNVQRNCSGAPVSHGAAVLLDVRVLHKISFGQRKRGGL